MSAVWNCPSCTVANAPRSTVCDACGYERPAIRQEPSSPPRACRCGDTSSPSTTEFPDDGAPDDRGVRLCPVCTVEALKRRAALHPLSADERAAMLTTLKASLEVIHARAVTTR